MEPAPHLGILDCAVQRIGPVIQLLEVLSHVFFPTNLHSVWAMGCSGSVLSVVWQHEYIVQLSMISPGNAGGESGKMH